MHEFKFFQPDSEIPEIEPYKIDIRVAGVPYYIGKFPGYVHCVDRRWGENDIWAWPRKEKPSYYNLVAYKGAGTADWGIRYENLATFGSHHELQTIVDMRRVTITRNDEDFYVFYGPKDFELEQAKLYISRIQNHPIRFNEIDYENQIIGRKIYWRSQPAIICEYIEGRGSLDIKPDGMERFNIPREFVWRNNLVYPEETLGIDIFDENIWWYREE